METGLVLVTGANGFVGKRVVIELLRSGFAVRGSVRSEGKAEAVRVAVRSELGEDAVSGLDFIRADLRREPRWPEAMKGVDALMHVAAMVSSKPEDSASIIETAHEGTARMLRHAIAAGVERVVLTASTETVGYGDGLRRGGTLIHTEASFTNLDAMRSPSAATIGKTRAERTAWAYARAEGLKLTTIHPGLILGPALDQDVSASLDFISRLLEGGTMALPRVGCSVVDVRDVAALHVAALKVPAAEGQRYLAVAGHLSLIEIAEILQRAYPERVMATRSVPDWLVQFRALLGRADRAVLPDLGVERRYDGSKGAALLDRPYISAEAAVLAAAESLVRLGLVTRQGQA